MKIRDFNEVQVFSGMAKKSLTGFLVRFLDVGRFLTNKCK